MTFFITCKPLSVSYCNIDWCFMNASSRRKPYQMYFVSSEKSSGSYWSHNALTPPPPPRPTSIIRQSMQERVDMIIIKVQSITNHFFMKGKQNISSLHKIICSLVSLFLWYIMKVVAACKVSSVFNHISPSFL